MFWKGVLVEGVLGKFYIVWRVNQEMFFEGGYFIGRMWIWGIYIQRVEGKGVLLNVGRVERGDKNRNVEGLLLQLGN